MPTGQQMLDSGDTYSPYRQNPYWAPNSLFDSPTSPEGFSPGMIPPPVLGAFAPTPQVPQLLFMPGFASGKADLASQLKLAVAQQAAARDQQLAFQRQQTGRLASSESKDMTSLDTNLLGRNVFFSGNRPAGRQQIDKGFEQQRNDLASQVANALNSIALNIAQARLGYRTGLDQLIAQNANYTSALPGGGLYPAQSQSDAIHQAWLQSLAGGQYRI